MSSKIVSTMIVVSGLTSLPLYAAELKVPFLNHLVSPIGHVDAGTWFLICAGIASLIITRRFVR